ncbi:MAG: 4-hydroxythreonine-4-phosphate dehydrogenase PdxA [Aestuariivirga sp.]|nr:4-hydroxythreonine-4-phosphate dehydrogenase PdxA [Aestuariivirga sp.]
MGDPAGIGPETVVKMFMRRPGQHRWIAVGDPGVFGRALRLLDCPAPLSSISAPEDAQAGRLNVLKTSHVAEAPPFGRVSAACGQAAYDAIAAAVELAQSGRVAGIVTAPINKEALAAASVAYPGHTEMLAELSGSPRVAMMLANDEIRTVLVTVHCSLMQAIRSADFPAQMTAIRLAHQGTQALGVPRPRIAVAGLNPHAGEGGLFGDEEERIIRPAVRAACAEGMDVSGPWPGDTVFMQARDGRFDVVVAQYHDQGLIPLKYLGLARGVNITLGLPFIRTSPDHGTAFDIAGRGIADSSSLETAFDYAVKLWENQDVHHG